jgi:hypothetical protein
MKAVCFKRHEKNPLDTLDIGRVMERRREKYYQFADQNIEAIQTLFSKFKGVKMQGWENIYDINPEYSDPFDGVIIKFTVVSYPIINVEKIYTGEFETRLGSGISSVSLYLKSFAENLKYFGSAEECYDSLENWIKKLTEGPEIKFDRW